MFEVLGKEGLKLYGVSPDAAVTWAIGFHALSYIPITVIGAWYFVRAGLSLDEISSVEKDATAEPDSTPAAP